jgi:hypothetical protein
MALFVEFVPCVAVVTSLLGTIHKHEDTQRNNGVVTQIVKVSNNEMGRIPRLIQLPAVSYQ